MCSGGWFSRSGRGEKSIERWQWTTEGSTSVHRHLNKNTRESLTFSKNPSISSIYLSPLALSEITKWNRVPNNVSCSELIKFKKKKKKLENVFILFFFLGEFMKKYLFWDNKIFFKFSIIFRKHGWVFFSKNIIYMSLNSHLNNIYFNFSF